MGLRLTANASRFCKLVESSAYVLVVYQACFEEDVSCKTCAKLFLQI